MHRRAKVRNGVAPYAVDDEFELVVPCTCAEDHKPLTVDINQSGQPKEIKGNDACWYGMFEFCTSHLKKPTTKLLQNWKQSADCFFLVPKSLVRRGSKILKSVTSLASAP